MKNSLDGYQIEVFVAIILGLSRQSCRAPLLRSHHEVATQLIYSSLGSFHRTCKYSALKRCFKFCTYKQLLEPCLLWNWWASAIRTRSGRLSTAGRGASRRRPTSVAASGSSASYVLLADIVAFTAAPRWAEHSALEIRCRSSSVLNSWKLQ